MIYRWVLCCLPALVAAPACAADVQVELRAQVAAQGPQVLLGDVAYVRGNEFEAVARLVRLPLGRAPVPGTDTRLSREAVLRWARSQLGGLASRVEWIGADEVLISQEARGGQGPGEPRAERDATPVVARGEWVTLLARHGGIELESPAEALQDGRVGQPVRVRPTGASGSIVARVVAPGRVEIGQ
jgi:flagella basal body P-ring formation protein FlgA